MRFQAPRGTHDVLPSESYRWQHLERTFADLVALYGYQDIRTPVFEDTNLFVRTSGDTSEIVTKQMYSFTDKGDRSITLKPEGTAPAIRAYLEHNLGGQGAVSRLSYVTPIFRYERPQQGRYRQAHQVGLELIGSPSPLADAEVIEITVKFYQRLGISGVNVLLNSIGRQETRNRYRDALLDHVKPWLAAQPTETQDRANKNPLRLLDSKDPEMIDLLKDAPMIVRYLEDSSRLHFETLLLALNEANVPYTLSPEIVRGLDYYTDTVFEVQSGSLGSQNSLCGGGRYDDLIKEMGGPDTPSVGVAMGIERAIMVQEAENVVIDEPKPEVYVVTATPTAKGKVIELARTLRSAGISTIFDFDDRSLKSQMKQADRVGARLALIIGDDELAAGTVTIRTLASSDQTQVAAADVLDRVGKR